MVIGLSLGYKEEILVGKQYECSQIGNLLENKIKVLLRRKKAETLFGK